MDSFSRWVVSSATHSLRNSQLLAIFPGRISCCLPSAAFCSWSVCFELLARQQVYRGKIFGPILAMLAILMFGFFSYVFFYVLRQVPPSTGAPRVGQKAPEFTLSDQDGKDVSLRDLVSRSKAVALIFYRGFW